MLNRRFLTLYSLSFPVFPAPYQCNIDMTLKMSEEILILLLEMPYNNWFTKSTYILHGDELYKDIFFQSSHVVCPYSYFHTFSFAPSFNPLPYHRQSHFYLYVTYIIVAYLKKILYPQIKENVITILNLDKYDVLQLYPFSVKTQNFILLYS